MLDPVSRVSEVVFGLIMAMTFTGSLSIATSARDEVRTMLVGAIGCNIAWGLVDAVMYVLTRLTERRRARVVLRSVRLETDGARAAAVIADALPEPVAAVMTREELESLRTRLRELPEPEHRVRVNREDVVGAIAVFLLVVLSTFPLVLPFIFVPHAGTALRVSNAVAIGMLFVCGYKLGAYSGGRPWRMGLAMAVLGAALAALTMALGG